MKARTARSHRAAWRTRTARASRAPRAAVPRARARRAASEQQHEAGIDARQVEKRAGVAEADREQRGCHHAGEPIACAARSRARAISTSASAGAQRAMPRAPPAATCRSTRSRAPSARTRAADTERNELRARRRIHGQRACDRRSACCMLAPSIHSSGHGNEYAPGDRQQQRREPRRPTAPEQRAQHAPEAIARRRCAECRPCVRDPRQCSSRARASASCPAIDGCSSPTKNAARPSGLKLRASDRCTASASRAQISSTRRVRQAEVELILARCRRPARAARAAGRGGAGSKGGRRSRSASGSRARAQRTRACVRARGTARARLRAPRTPRPRAPTACACTARARPPGS